MLEGVLMAATIEEIQINNKTVPMVFEEAKKLPIVSMQFIFENAGQLSDTKDGIADIASRVMNEGTKAEGSTRFATTLDAHAIELHSSVGRESFVIEVSSLKSEFTYAIERLKALLQDPNYTQEAFEQVIRQKFGWIKQKESDFDYISSVALRSELFKGSVLARAYDGTEESIKSITLEEVEAFISSRIGYNNASVVAGGDISVEEAKRYGEAVLSILGVVDTNATSSIVVLDKQTTIEKQEETQQAYLSFGSPFYFSYQEKDQYKAKIAEYLLGGGGFGTRMMEEIRVKRGLAYSVYATFRTSKYTSYLSGALQTKLSTQEEAKKIVQEVVDTFVSKGITNEELQKAKKFLVGSEPLRTETLSQRLSRAYNEFYYNRPLGFSADQLRLIDSVTLEEMNAFITSHKEIAKLSFAIVTKNKM